MASVPAGGPSTVNGVLYQLLYSLLTLGSCRAIRNRVDDGRIEELTLILEPSTGGDQQSVYGARRVVTQLKARSTRAPWSLQEVVRNVLPDLYRAVNDEYPDTEYQFVTEGEQGRWGQVDRFFRGLGKTPDDARLESLSDTDDLTFGRVRSGNSAADSFWEGGSYTERRLFRKIVDTLRERPEVDQEPYGDTVRKTWHLLRGFRFIGGITHDGLRAELDRWLLGRIGSADRLSERRDHLLLELAQLACSGNAIISASAFLESSGLANTSLVEWAQLSRKAHSHLRGVLERKQIEVSGDARPALTTEILAGWTLSRPIVVLAGESGCGKSWHAYRALLSLAEADVSIVVDSRGDADRDLKEAAETFWHKILGTDEAPPLSRLRPRLSKLDPANESRGVTLFVDNVSCVDEAQRLIEYDWEGDQIRLAITCTPSVARGVRRLLADRGRELEVGNYTLTELQTFLADVLGIGWERVPFDVRKSIRRPLLANLFGELMSDSPWEPRNEYELFERAWDNLHERRVNRFDVSALSMLAVELLLCGARYPWTIEQLRERGIDALAADRLLSSGWLRETTSGAYEVWHDRLLNWTVAEAVVHELRNDSGCEGTTLASIAELLITPVSNCGRNLGYVPLDVVWLLSANGETDLPLRLLAAFEDVLKMRSESLYKELLPTMGSRAVPLLSNRLQVAIERRDFFAIDYLVDGLVATGEPGVSSDALQMLGSPDGKVRRAAIRVIKQLPTAEALEPVWAVHVDGGRNPERYSLNQQNKWILYQETFAALRACVVKSRDWLIAKINRCDPASEPVHDLGYLVATTRDETIWSACRETLLRKIDVRHERAIANCVLAFRDRRYVDWLESRFSKVDNMVGLVSIRALTAMDAARALSRLDSVDDIALCLGRQSCFAELYLRLPDDVMRWFSTKLRSHSDPWQFARVLQDREDLIDPETFDFLLNRFSELLANSLSQGSPPPVTAGCRFGLAFLNAVRRPALLDRLKERRGTELDQVLADWAIGLGPQLDSWRNPEKFDALDALARIGGAGLNRVLDYWLEHCHWVPCLHAAQLAQRRFAHSTMAILTRLSENRDVPGDDEHRMVLSGEATASLAVHCCWEPVLRYYLRVGLNSLNVVDECCPVIDPPLDDTVLAEALAQFGQEMALAPGAVSCIALASRRDLLPKIREALQGAPIGSELAGSCLLALKWLRDSDPAAVAAIERQFDAHPFLATNALLANGTPEADTILAKKVLQKPDFQLAMILAANPGHRDLGLRVLRTLAIEECGFRLRGGLEWIAARANSELLSQLADCAELFGLAEEVAYSPYEPFRITGEKSAALHILGVREPDVAVQMALVRMRDSDTPDPEEYVPIVAKFRRENAAALLLDVAIQDPPTRIIQAIGRELGQLGETDLVIEWMSRPDVEARRASCRAAGFLPFTDELDAAVRARVNDPDNRVLDVAVEASEGLVRNRTATELMHAILEETDVTHCWTLLDAIIAIADPWGGGTPTPWQPTIYPRLTPAMQRHLWTELKRRRETLVSGWDSESRRRR